MTWNMFPFTRYTVSNITLVKITTKNKLISVAVDSETEISHGLDRTYLSVI